MPSAPRLAASRQFTVPALKPDADPLKVWEELRAAYAPDSTERRVQRIEYTHRGQDYISEVGYTESDGANTLLVFAIFEPSMAGTPWKVVAGVQKADGWAFRNPPILVGKNELRSITDFTE